MGFCEQGITKRKYRKQWVFSVSVEVALNEILHIFEQQSSEKITCMMNALYFSYLSARGTCGRQNDKMIENKVWANFVLNLDQM